MQKYSLLTNLSTQEERSKIIDLFGRVTKRDKHTSTESLEIALLAAMAMFDNGLLAENTLTVHEVHNHIALAICIVKAMAAFGESRFTAYDYMDAVINSTRTVDIEKLLELDEESFGVALTWLATDKRETYEDREHEQEPLELDVFA